VSPAPVLVLPGYGDSGPEHWQSRLEAADATCRRVVQRDWLEPTLPDWLAELDRAVEQCPAPPVFVAHSLGCALVAHWAGRTRRAAAGALLVAPADVDALASVLDAVASFAPLPTAPLPFPSIVVASDDDPYVTVARARAFAQAWGSRFVAIGRAGHINTDSGYGDWPAGVALLRELRGGTPAG
jgi:predicted alpha/beta hydrolase family esterase